MNASMVALKKQRSSIVNALLLRLSLILPNILRLRELKVNLGALNGNIARRRFSNI